MSQDSRWQRKLLAGRDGSDAVAYTPPERIMSEAQQEQEQFDKIRTEISVTWKAVVWVFLVVFCCWGFFFSAILPSNAKHVR